MGQRITFLKQLREMNIHSASLFPGLDGFGKSLKNNLKIKAAEVGKVIA
jgi:PII-like signaling protein